ncbi:MAG: ABC transporter substrate-binding protein [Proteobacteria bacterium]|nr:ABC transporter substrate-binding protein [Desulfobacula sp.]MBU3953604.1 ABC transporter substrate-binding protein [Pseudomonadota bacterium]MBU4131300.1 ABC transporter substrate-binding protein [Pseudomonadota bacterium]
MTKKRIFRLFVSIFFILGLARLYLTPGADTPVGKASRTITDMKGRTFDVADPLERIALLGGPTGQVAFILGIQDRLCAVTHTLKMSKLVQENYPPIRNLPGPRTTSGSINIEELILSNPDLAIAGDIDGGIVLTKTQIPVAFLEDSMGEGMVDIKREIRFYGYLFETPERAGAYVAFLDRIMALVRERTKDIPAAQRKKVFQGYSPSHLVTLGGDTFMQERIALAGCRNAAETVTTIGQRTGLHSGLGEISMEQVLDWNPDILIINSGTVEDITQNSQWQNIRAVQHRQIYAQPAGVFIFNRPTAESAVIFPLWLASIAYPERFADLSVPALVKEFYKDIFTFDLSDRQVKDILSGTYEFRMMKGIKNKG